MSAIPARIARSAQMSAPAHMQAASQVETAIKSLPVWVYAFAGVVIGVCIAIVVL